MFVAQATIHFCSWFYVTSRTTSLIPAGTKVLKDCNYYAQAEIFA